MVNEQQLPALITLVIMLKNRTPVGTSSVGDHTEMGVFDLSA
jgi:hypothetical protein